MRLPLRNKGCGLREAEDIRYAQFIGAVAQCIPQLIDRLDKEGNIVPGRLNTESVMRHRLLGRGKLQLSSHEPMGAYVREG